MRQLDPVNPVCTLKLAHIGNYSAQIGIGKLRLKRRVSKLPVMRPHTILDGEFKRLVSMM